MLPPTLGEGLGKRFRGIGRHLLAAFPDVAEQLAPAGITLDPQLYVGMSLANAGVLSLLFSLLMGLLMFAQGRPMNQLVGLTIAIFFGILLVFLLLFMRYPAILALKRADLINQDLIFALKDLVLQLSSGINLYEAFKDLSRSEYKQISEEFAGLIHTLDTGVSMIDALEDIALTTRSQYLKRTCWQIVNSLKTGTNLRDVLERIIKELGESQKNKIRNYARELNLWSLLYMLFAVAVPSIGSTMLVILSSFAGFGITKEAFIFFIAISLVTQGVLIGFVRSRRPAVGM